MDFNIENQRRIERFETILQKYLPAEEGQQKVIFEAMNYSLLVGGKRVRPILMQAVYEAFGGTGEEVEPFMAAQEMIHTYSLVHDDLPCMDNDTMRRGKPSTWSAYGEDMGVLCGDALLGYAFETALKATALTTHTDRICRAMSILAQKAGCDGMLGGQVVDVALTGKTMTAEQMDFIFRLKTGALLESCMMIGAVLAGASEAQVQQVAEVALAVGMAFQIRDDILDVIGDQEVLGKPVLSDEKNNKVTYVTLYGMERAEADVQAYMDRAEEGLAQFPGDTTFLREYFHRLVDRVK